MEKHTAKKFLLVFALCFFAIPLLYSINLTKSSIIQPSSILAPKSSIVSENSSLIIQDTTLLDSSTILSENSSFIDLEDCEIYGSYVITHGKSFIDPYLTSYMNNSIDTAIVTTTSNYIGEFDRYLTITLGTDRNRFINYLLDWQKAGMEDDFFSYVKKTYDEKKLISQLYDEAILKFGVGSVVLVVELTIFYLSPEPITKAIALICLKDSLINSSIGALTGGVVANFAATQNGDSSELIIAKTINGIADGYMIGAITGTVSGIATGKIVFKDAFNSKTGIILKNGAVISPTGKTIGQALKNQQNQFSYIVQGDSVFDLNGISIGKILTNENGNFIIDSVGNPIFFINASKQAINSTVNGQLNLNALLKANPNDKIYYRELYKATYPDRIFASGDEFDVVHHAIERTVLDRYPGVFSGSEILQNPTNFRGILHPDHFTLHNSTIKSRWIQTYKRIDSVVEPFKDSYSEIEKQFIRNEILKERDLIDANFSSQFIENIGTIGGIYL